MSVLDFDHYYYVHTNAILLLQTVETVRMPNLRASEHYIWCDNDVLGRGATGEVYKARNKVQREAHVEVTRLALESFVPIWLNQS